MIPFHIEMLNSGANLPLLTLFITFDIAIATFRNMLNMVVLKEHVNKIDMEKVGYRF